MGCTQSNIPHEAEYFDFEGQTKKARVVSVYDGDTVTVVLDIYGRYHKYKVRLAGIDTPELKPPKNMKNREKEIEKAIKAKKYLEGLILGKVVTLVCGKFEKYGRILAHIYFKVNGIKMCANKMLLDEGYAVEYYGGTKGKN